MPWQILRAEGDAIMHDTKAAPHLVASVQKGDVAVALCMQVHAAEAQAEKQASSAFWLNDKHLYIDRLSSLFTWNEKKTAFILPQQTRDRFSF